ncbi:MAG: RluA family pseudouridine synthase [Phycisphaerae bacterium]|nr:RluA family pseudouridine synthase [Phycisphaerae bacterium]NNF41543.1 RluA family pseudouridine synthase [Phycisphaerales bacterium]
MGPKRPDVLFRDERILVLDKPSGLLSVPGIGPEKADCLVTRVQSFAEGARIVHRLDRDTSGVIVMAFDAEAHRSLSVQFQERQVDKAYLAIAAGQIEPDEGVIDLPIAKDLANPPRQRVDREHGRPSLTRYRVLTRDRERNQTRLELTPRTGRSHQLRVHLLALGHPVVGDDLYAPPAVRDAADRLLLHAWRLRVAHPSTAAPMEFEAACPF